MSLSDLIVQKLQAAAASYTEGPAGLYDSRGDTYHAINIGVATDSKSDETLSTELAKMIIDALRISPHTAVEYIVAPRITVRGPKTLCYARISAHPIM